MFEFDVKSILQEIWLAKDFELLFGNSIEKCTFRKMIKKLGFDLNHESILLNTNIVNIVLFYK